MVVLLLYIPVHAQDIHFSQIDLNPVLFNPAYAGFFEGKARFGLDYRTQWGTVGEAYQTFAATAELSVTRSRYRHNGFNIGLISHRDRAGELSYGTTQGNIIISYYQSPSGNDDNYISMSVEAGYGQAGFDPNNAHLFDATETFATQSTNYFTIGAGVAWFYQPNDKFMIRMAASARNLNRPNISYLGLDSSRLSVHWNIYGRIEWRLNDSWAVVPIVAAQLQHQYFELYYGADLKWYLRDDRQRIVPYAGFMMRHADAAVFTIGCEYDAFAFALSYDANVSKLVAASRSIGAIELGLVYRLIPIKKRHKSLPCPIM